MQARRQWRSIGTPLTTAAMTDDLAELAARFGAALRRAGLPVGPGRSERFAAAVTLVRPETRRDLFNCALATLVSSKDQADALRVVFTQVFGALEEPGQLPGAPQTAVEPPGSPHPAELADAATAARTHGEILRSVDGDRKAHV